jgi:hypothetical protein
VVDARAHPRYACEIDAEVRLPGRKVPARTHDVSRGGMAFTADQAIPSGSEVQISMALVFDEETFSEPLDVRARVVWCTPLGQRFQIGTSFIGLTNENRNYLEMFLRYLREGLARKAEEDAAAAPKPPPGDENPFG